MKNGYLLHSGEVLTTSGAIRADLLVRGARIKAIGGDVKPGKGVSEIDCTGHLVVPGLINSHDHLDFNLFPKLGEPPYENAYDWGEDLQRRWAKTIGAVKTVPYLYRLRWGAWKNLFSGVTHVVHHEPYSHHFRLNFPVNVLRHYTSVHSLGFEQDITHTLAKRKTAIPFLIHLAEGKDDIAAGEVGRLHSFGGLDDRTVAVHAVGVSDSDVGLFEQQKASVACCPSSNMFLFGQSAPLKSLLGRVPVALGTDSTLTGNVTMFEEMRTARDWFSLTAREVYSLVTEMPRSIYRMPADAGQIVEGGRADLFVIPRNRVDPFEQVLHALPGDIMLLMRNGATTMCDETFHHLNGLSQFSRISLNRRVKYLKGEAFNRLYDAVQPFVSHYDYISPA